MLSGKLFVLASLAAATFAQRISIGSPSSEANLAAGRDTTVQVIKPNSLSPSVEIGIAITLQHCKSNPCEDVSQFLGQVLYSGAFNPSGTGGPDRQPFENFTIKVPSSFQSGDATLSVVHANLIGAGPYLFTEVANVTVKITN